MVVGESESTERQKVHLDRSDSTVLLHVLPCQKAPSAKRCIKTLPLNLVERFVELSQKAPSAKRCIKTSAEYVTLNAAYESERTERQKVH